MGQGEGSGTLLFSGIEFQDGVMNISWRWGSEDGWLHSNANELNITELYTEKMVKIVKVMLCRFLP